MRAVVPSEKVAVARAVRIVPYLMPEEVYRTADAAKEGRNGERD